MAVTTVGTVITNAKRVLQEVTADGTRWTNGELLDWLNESYQAVIQIKPDAGSVNATMALVPGTLQSIPPTGLRLLDVVRNTASSSSQMAILVTDRRSLDMTRRAWHSDPATLDIEQYVFDDQDPTRFYVYPPAAEGAEINLIYSQVPSAHDVASGLDGVKDEPIKVNDAYAPVLTDYVLYRSFSKDAEHAANLQRAQFHQQAFMTALGQKIPVDRATSPNADLMRGGA
nr:DUF6682 family protein [uncultured Halomonas sp.]